METITTTNPVKAKMILKSFDSVYLNMLSELMVHSDLSESSKVFEDIVESLDDPLMSIGYVPENECFIRYISHSGKKYEFFNHIDKDGQFVEFEIEFPKNSSLAEEFHRIKKLQ